MTSPVPEHQLANAIRALSMDAVQRANSGHPGAPMGMADIATVLWREFLQHNPANPGWANRDRFVLSNGHGSMLLYSLLHLTGYDLTIDDLKQFRQFHSRTPGHPEYGYTPGVETTTGPLGQGLTNAVGMALAEKTLAAQFNRPGHELVDHHTWVFLGDGCLMEGISQEACSLAGTLKLGKLIAFYDCNGISIDGDVTGWFADDTAARFAACGWHVIREVDGHDHTAIRTAARQAQRETEKPSLIICNTVIGYGSPNKAGSHDAHGAPLGEEEIGLTRARLGWQAPPFVIPEEIRQAWDRRASGAAAENAWQQRFQAYRSAFPVLAESLHRRIQGDLPHDWTQTVERYIASLQANPATLATRKASQDCLEALAPHLPELLGGSADLSPSNLTAWSGSRALDQHADGNYVRYGVREFGMSAIMNGIALHGGFIPYGGTFLMFMEYARNAVRMAALMRLRTLFVYTHDSIGLGEDGPTHQPVEQLASLRLTPNMRTWRPCDRVETAVAWRQALERRDGPSALVLSRQNLAQQTRSAQQVADIARGGYILHDATGQPEIILLATGSEIPLAMEAAQQLTRQGVAVRVVSMPSTETFDKQDKDWRDRVLPPRVRARLAIEAGIADFWHKYVGSDGAIIGMHGFGESAPAAELFRHFGFTGENVVEQALRLLNHR